MTLAERVAWNMAKMEEMYGAQRDLVISRLQAVEANADVHDVLMDGAL